MPVTRCLSHIVGQPIRSNPCVGLAVLPDIGRPLEPRFHDAAALLYWSTDGSLRSTTRASDDGFQNAVARLDFLLREKPKRSSFGENLYGSNFGSLGALMVIPTARFVTTFSMRLFRTP